MMRPFFTMLGGKHKLAQRIGPPQRRNVREPFAGSAGYSTYYEPADVTLIERDPVIYGVWDFLQRSSPADIMALPSNIDSVEEIPQVCQEARWLIGYWFNHATPRPGITRSNWARIPKHRASFWSETIKLRIASQVDRIRHWKIIHGSYEDAPNVDAHWHIDPPYRITGREYNYSEINYADLAEWCTSRRGFVQVCESTGADWLPFEEYAVIANRFRSGVASEAVFEMENDTRGVTEVADAS